MSSELYHNARGWHPINANITMLRLSNTLDASSGYDNQFCEVRYKYKVRKVVYSGNRANVWGNLATARYCDFLEVRTQLENVVCWYDPRKPEDSVLDRRLRPMSLLISVSVGVTLAFGSVAMLIFDGSFKVMPQWASGMLSWTMATAVVWLCVRVVKLTKSLPPVAIGLGISVFLSTAASCCLIADEFHVDEVYETEWVYDENLGLLTIPASFNRDLNNDF